MFRGHGTIRSNILKIISLIILTIFIPQTLFAQVSFSGGLQLPTPGTMVPVTSATIPILIKGITLHPENPLRFDFIVNSGDTKAQDDAMKEAGLQQIKYFLAALTVPEKEMWVNLSPYEKNRIIPESFGDTEMGRDLLAQDYMLKQLTASLMNPEDKIGKNFWQRVYDKAWKQFGTTDIPTDTFHKVWIVPDRAVVYEKGSSVPTPGGSGLFAPQGLVAFVVDAHLKVMLEEDYVAAQQTKDHRQKTIDQPSAQKRSVVSGLQSPVSDLIRSVLLPEIEKEINEGKTFVTLRQIYNAMILATWYKKRLKESLLGKVYVDKAKTKGVNVDDKDINQKIYNQYIEAFKKGVCNYIKEEYDPINKQLIPRKYFTGGFDSAMLGKKVQVIDGTLPGDKVILTKAAQESPDSRDINLTADLKEANMSGPSSPGYTISGQVTVNDEKGLHSRPMAALADFGKAMKSLGILIRLKVGGQEVPIYEGITKLMMLPVSVGKTLDVSISAPDEPSGQKAYGCLQTFLDDRETINNSADKRRPKIEKLMKEVFGVDYHFDAPVKKASVVSLQPIPPSGITTISAYSYGEFHDAAGFGDVIARQIKADNIFNAEIQGDKLEIGFSGFDDRHGDIENPSLGDHVIQGSYTFRMKEVELLPHLATSIDDNWTLQAYENSVRLARLLTEYGFPEETVLSGATKAKIGDDFETLNQPQTKMPETLGALARLHLKSDENLSALALALMNRKSKGKADRAMTADWIEPGKNAVSNIVWQKVSDKEFEVKEVKNVHSYMPSLIRVSYDGKIRWAKIIKEGEKFQLRKDEKMSLMPQAKIFEAINALNDPAFLKAEAFLIANIESKPRKVIIMEDLPKEGKSLEDWVKDEALPMDKKMEVIFKAVQALETFHKKIGIHADIKPGNFWVTEKNGELQVILFDYDFSFRTRREFAKRKLDQSATDDFSSEKRLKEKYILSKIRFMRWTAGPRDDFYALAGVLFYSIVGKRNYIIYRERFKSDIKAFIEALPERGIHISQELADFFEKALPQKGECLYDSADTFIKDLMAVPEAAGLSFSQTDQAMTTSTIKRFFKTVTSKPVLLSTLTASSILLSDISPAMIHQRQEFARIEAQERNKKSSLEDYGKRVRLSKRTDFNAMYAFNKIVTLFQEKKGSDRIAVLKVLVDVARHNGSFQEEAKSIIEKNLKSIYRMEGIDSQILAYLFYSGFDGAWENIEARAKAGNPEAIKILFEFMEEFGSHSPKSIGSEARKVIDGIDFGSLFKKPGINWNLYFLDRMVLRDINGNGSLAFQKIVDLAIKERNANAVRSLLNFIEFDEYNDKLKKKAREALSRIDFEFLFNQDGIDPYLFADIAENMMGLGSDAAFKEVIHQAKIGNVNAIISLGEFSRPKESPKKYKVISQTEKKENKEDIDFSELLESSSKGLSPEQYKEVKETRKSIDIPSLPKHKQFSVDELSSMFYAGNVTALDELISRAKEDKIGLLYLFDIMLYAKSSIPKALKEKAEAVVNSINVDMLPAADRDNLGFLIHLSMVGGNEFAFSKVVSLLGQENQEEEAYYQIGSCLLDVYLNNSTPKEMKQKALSTLKGKYREVVNSLMVKNKNSPEVVQIVNNSLDAIGSPSQDGIKGGLFNTFHRDPQGLLFYLTMPNVVQPLVDAHAALLRTPKGKNLDFSFFLATAFAEGYIVYARGLLDNGIGGPFTFFQPLGLDRFSIVVNDLAKQGFLPAGFKGYTIIPGSERNKGQGLIVKEGMFHTPTAALIALGALLLQDMENVGRMGYAKELVGDDAFYVLSYLSFVAGSGKVEKYVQEADAAKGPAKVKGQNIVGFVGKYGTGSHGYPPFNAQWPRVTALYLTRAGVINFSAQHLNNIVRKTSRQNNEKYSVVAPERNPEAQRQAKALALATSGNRSVTDRAMMADFNIGKISSSQFVYTDAPFETWRQDISMPLSRTDDLQKLRNRVEQLGVANNVSPELEPLTSGAIFDQFANRFKQMSKEEGAAFLQNILLDQKNKPSIAPTWTTLLREKNGQSPVLFYDEVRDILPGHNLARVMTLTTRDDGDTHATEFYFIDRVYIGYGVTRFNSGFSNLVMTYRIFSQNSHSAFGQEEKIEGLAQKIYEARLDLWKNFIPQGGEATVFVGPSQYEDARALEFYKDKMHFSPLSEFRSDGNEDYSQGLFHILTNSDRAMTAEAPQSVDRLLSRVAHEHGVFYAQLIQLVAADMPDVEKEKKIEQLLSQSQLPSYFKALYKKKIDDARREISKNRNLVRQTPSSRQSLWLRALKTYGYDEAAVKDIASRTLPYVLYREVLGLPILDVRDHLFRKVFQDSQAGTQKSMDRNLSSFVVMPRKKINGPASLSYQESLSHEGHHLLLHLTELSGTWEEAQKKIRETTPERKEAFWDFRDEFIAYTLLDELAQTPAIYLVYNENPEILSMAGQLKDFILFCMDIAKKRGVGRFDFIYADLRARNFEELKKNVLALVPLQKTNDGLFLKFVLERWAKGDKNILKMAKDIIIRRHLKITEKGFNAAVEQRKGVLEDYLKLKEGLKDVFSSNQKIDAAMTSVIPTEQIKMRDEIKEGAKAFNYSDEISGQFADMVLNWKVLGTGSRLMPQWKKIAEQILADVQSGKMTKQQAAEAQRRLMGKIGRAIKRRIPYKIVLGLEDVLSLKKAMCQEYTKMIYIIARALGGYKPQAAHITKWTGSSTRIHHVAAFLGLLDGTDILVDLASEPLYVSPRLHREKIYSQQGVYLVIRDNVIFPYKTIRIVEEPTLIAFKYNSLGFNADKKGDLMQAAEYLTKASQLDPDFADSYFNLGTVYVRMALVTKAKEFYLKANKCFTKAIEIEPDYVDAYDNLGVSYLRAGDLVNALKSLSQAIQLDSNDANAYYNRALVYEKYGDIDKAIRDYREAIRCNPAFRKAYERRGMAFQKKGLMGYAEADFKIAEKLRSKKSKSDAAMMVETPKSADGLLSRVAHQHGKFYLELIKILASEKSSVQKDEDIENLFQGLPRHLKLLYRKGAQQARAIMDENLKTVHQHPGHEAEYLLGAFLKEEKANNPSLDIDAVLSKVPVHGIYREISGLPVIEADEVLQNVLIASKLWDNFVQAETWTPEVEEQLPLTDSRQPPGFILLRKESRGREAAQLNRQHELHHLLTFFLEQSRFLRSITESTSARKKAFRDFRHEVIAYIISKPGGLNTISERNLVNPKEEDKEEIYKLAIKMQDFITLCMEIASARGVPASDFIYPVARASNFKELQNGVLALVPVKPAGDIDFLKVVLTRLLGNTRDYANLREAVDAFMVQRHVKFSDEDLLKAVKELMSIVIFSDAYGLNGIVDLMSRSIDAFFGKTFSSAQIASAVIPFQESSVEKVLSVASQSNLSLSAGTKSQEEFVQKFFNYLKVADAETRKAYNEILANCPDIREVFDKVKEDMIAKGEEEYRQELENMDATVYQIDTALRESSDLMRRLGKSLNPTSTDLAMTSTEEKTERILESFDENGVAQMEPLPVMAHQEQFVGEIRQWKAELAGLVRENDLFALKKEGDAAKIEEAKKAVNEKLLAFVDFLKQNLREHFKGLENHPVLDFQALNNIFMNHGYYFGSGPKSMAEEYPVILYTVEKEKSGTLSLSSRMLSADNQAPYDAATREGIKLIAVRQYTQLPGGVLVPVHGWSALNRQYAVILEDSFEIFDGLRDAAIKDPRVVSIDMIQHYQKLLAQGVNLPFAENHLTAMSSLFENILKDIDTDIPVSEVKRWNTRVHEAEHQVRNRIYEMKGYTQERDINLEEVVAILGAMIDARVQSPFLSLALTIMKAGRNGGYSWAALQYLTGQTAANDVVRVLTDIVTSRDVNVLNQYLQSAYAKADANWHKACAADLDAAMMGDEKKGGIDLNFDLMDLQIKRDGNGVPLPLFQQPVESIKIDGFVPVIIDVKPAPSLPVLLGVTTMSTPGVDKRFL
ncbi:MAG: tetratricopeptide repeat protein [Candidatus Omnitrophica bacterium]|nr:tetratricopeptide repeat protein [Candidatus Omnitrophota bacterium]